MKPIFRCCIKGWRIENYQFAVLISIDGFSVLSGFSSGFLVLMEILTGFPVSDRPQCPPREVDISVSLISNELIESELVTITELKSWRFEVSSKSPQFSDERLTLVGNVFSWISLRKLFYLKSSQLIPIWRVFPAKKKFLSKEFSFFRSKWKCFVSSAERYGFRVLAFSHWDVIKVLRPRCIQIKCAQKVAFFSTRWGSNRVSSRYYSSICFQEQFSWNKPFVLFSFYEKCSGVENDRSVYYFNKLYKKKKGKDGRKYNRAVQKLRREVEKAKRALSTKPGLRLNLSLMGKTSLTLWHEPALKNWTWPWVLSLEENLDTHINLLVSVLDLDVFYPIAGSSFPTFF